MSKSLVIVESPSKAKTINKYLGKDYKVLASVGHIKDLPKKGLGVDIENDFEPTYEVLPGTETVVKQIQDAAREAETMVPMHEANASATITRRLRKRRVTYEAIAIREKLAR